MQASVPAGLQRFPGYTLAQTFRVMRHAMDCALRDLGLTTPQFGVLACIGESESMSGAEMARIHHLTPQTINTVLHNLENIGLIERERHPQHGTLLLICLTDQGKERLAQAMDRVALVQERMMRDFDDQEQATLVSLLDRCAASLQSDGDLAVPCLED